jgi:predicted nucleotidyltransferase
MSARIGIDRQQQAEFCERWKIAEPARLGSVLRDDFRPDSDVDILVSFAPEADWSLFDHLRMEEELSGLGCVRQVVRGLGCREQAKPR